MDSVVRDAYKRTSLMVAFTFALVTAQALSINVDELSDQSKSHYTALEMSECVNGIVFKDAFVSSRNTQKQQSTVSLIDDITESRKTSFISYAEQTLVNRVSPYSNPNLDFPLASVLSRNYSPPINYTKGDNVSEKLQVIFSPPLILLMHSGLYNIIQNSKNKR